MYRAKAREFPKACYRVLDLGSSYYSEDIAHGAISSKQPTGVTASILVMVLFSGNETFTETIMIVYEVL